MHGKQQCRMHGGKSLVGSALPQFKHGRRSKYLPEQLRARYAEALSDPELLSMKAELGLIDVRLDDLLASLEGETGGKAILLAFRQQVNDIALMFRRRDYGSMMQGLLDLQAAVRDGAIEAAAWQQITDLIERRQRVTESERKRMLEIKQYVSVTQAQAYAAALLSSVQAHVTDPLVFRAIAQDFAALADRQQMVATDTDIRP
jgi:hypothetical protein